jgi:hypothetical protein
MVSVSVIGCAWMIAYGWLELPPLAHAVSSAARIASHPIGDVFIAASKSKEVRHYTCHSRLEAAADARLSRTAALAASGLHVMPALRDQLVTFLDAHKRMAERNIAVATPPVSAVQRKSLQTAVDVIY